MSGETDPAALLKEQAAGFLREVVELRVAVPSPGHDAEPPVVYQALCRARGHLERIEVLYGIVIGLKNSTASKAAGLEAEAEDAWEDQMKTDRNKYGGRREFEGAKERYAWANIAIRDQRLRARRARELADYMADTEERVRLVYRGLDSARYDLSRRLAYLQWDLTFER